MHFFSKSIIQSSYTISKVKFKHFSSIFNVRFQSFPSPYACCKLHSNQLGSLQLILFPYLKSELLNQRAIYYIDAIWISSSFKHFIQNPDLENITLKFKDFQGFLGLVQTQIIVLKMEKELLKYPQWQLFTQILYAMMLWACTVCISW